jgi:antitoxin MazE
MKIVKWGNSLAVRLPASVVDALDLKNGDHVDIRAAGWRVLDVARKSAPENFLLRLRAFRVGCPPDFKLHRDEGTCR